MKYQLRYLVHQLEHQKVCQIQESGQVQEWLFPLLKAARQALESLESNQLVPQKEELVEEVQESKDKLTLVQAEEQIKVLEPWVQAEALESAYWKPQQQQ